MRRNHAILFLVVVALSAAPLVWVETPALQDYPNALARAKILRDYEDPSMPYQDDFIRVFRPIPDMATDLLLPLFAPTLGWDGAGRVVLVLAVIGLPLGAWWLLTEFHRGRPGAPAAVVSVFWVLPFVQHWFLAMGLLNFSMGVGLSLAVLALWFRWSRAGWTALRVGLFAVVTTALYLTHLFAIGAAGLTVLAVLVAEKRGRRRALVDLAGFAPAIVLFLVYHTAEHEGGVGLSWTQPEDKLLSFVNLLATFSWPRAGVAAGVLIAGWFVVRQRFGMERHRLGVVIAATFAVAHLVFPRGMIGGYDIDHRALPYLVIGLALAWSPSARAVRPTIAAALLATVVATGGTTWELIRLDRSITPDVALLERLEPGRRVVSVNLREPIGHLDPTHHLVCWYTLLRGGTTSYQFAKPGQHVLQWRGPEHLGGPGEYFQREEAPFPPLDEVGRTFDYLWMMGRGDPYDRLRREAVLIAERGDVSIWELPTKAE